MRENYDLVIAGAGIVGLATALAITERSPDLNVAILEKESAAATHQTGHNSGVIHSGIYYRPGSMKAKFCVEGAAAMYAFCEEHGIAHDQCGKLVIATSNAQIPALEELHRRGVQNGVTGVRMLAREELCQFEPQAAGVLALHVSSAGITNYRDVAGKMAEILQNRGTDIVTSAEIRKIESRASAIRISSTAGDVGSKYFINCTGLYSDRIARLAGANLNVQIIPFRGEYYELTPSRRSLVRNLIYPVPDLRFPFLGVHFTRRINGQIEAGPNAVLALRREGYRKTDFRMPEMFEMLSFPGFWGMAKKYWRTGTAEMYRSLRKQGFVRALKELVPAIESEDLVPAGSGVRAQAVDRSGALLDDFSFVTQERALHVCNVPSPAATASLVIGRHIAKIVQDSI